MPNYTNADQTHIISEEEMAALYNHTPGLRERSWMIILWLTGARPAEALLLTKKDITIELEKTTFKIQTKKLNVKTKNFYIHHRTLVLRISSEHHYIRALSSFLRRFTKEDSRLFTFSIRTGYNIISRASTDTLGFTLCPYNFRHSRMTLLAESGASEETLKRFKGSFTTQSIRPYLHIRKVDYTIEV